MLKRLFRQRGEDNSPVGALAPGERVYAIGDIHGCIGLLDTLLDRIAADDATRPLAATSLIFLGDLVDRGPKSADVVERLRGLAREQPGMRFLLGNHEEVLLAALEGDERAVRGFCKMGGRETILSYGLDEQRYERMDYDEVGDALRSVVPDAHRQFLAGFEDLIVMGDYAFAHAGVDPNTALDAQQPVDLRWIRERFLQHSGPLEKVVVHGHTIAHEVEWRAHRIGIDTGAYETGRLTALGLQGDQRWLLQT